MRIISKSCYDAHTEPIFKSCYILPLNDMYLAEIGKITFQYQTGSLPDVFNNTFLRRNKIHDYDTRNASSFYVPKCRSNIRPFSFQYQDPSFFNSPSPDVVSSASVKLKKKQKLLEEKLADLARTRVIYSVNGRQSSLPPLPTVCITMRFTSEMK